VLLLDRAGQPIVTHGSRRRALGTDPDPIPGSGRRATDRHARRSIRAPAPDPDPDSAPPATERRIWDSDRRPADLRRAIGCGATLSSREGASPATAGQPRSGPRVVVGRARWHTGAPQRSLGRDIRPPRQLRRPPGEPRPHPATAGQRPGPRPRKTAAGDRTRASTQPAEPTRPLIGASLQIEEFVRGLLQLHCNFTAANVPVYWKFPLQWNYQH
jgi:hypothetical protein